MGQPPRSAEAVAEWSPGALVGRYALLAKIATGGMAEIWLADQQGPMGFTKLVVVKRILDSFSANPDFVSMFLDEARIAAQLSHPNIVQIFDLGEHAGAYYIAMEYLAGDALSTVVREGLRAGTPLPVPLAARLVAEAAAGLGHAHTKLGNDGRPLGIVHRDVSPQNLVVTFEGHTKVVDFGIARAANRATHTAEGQVKGKLAYMAPEQASGSLVDARSDVFALGVILFEAATGTRFYPSSELAQQVAILCGDGPLPRATDRSPRVPGSLGRIIDQALSRDPARRYANGSELHEALDGWLHSQAHSASVGAVEAYLKEAFGDKLGKHSELIESARARLGTPSGRRRPTGEAAAPTMPGNTPGPRRDHTVAESHRAGRPALTLAGAAGVTLVLAALAFGWRALSTPTVTRATVIELPLVPPPRTPAVATPSVLRVDSDPTGAAVAIDGVGRGLAPVEVSGLEPGEHVAVARLEGFQPLEQRVTLGADGTRVQLALALVPAPVARSPDRPGRPAGAKGKLTLQTSPVTEVFLAGKSLGETPLIELPLPAGTHALKLVNPADGAASMVEVEIAPGKTTVKKLRL